MQAMYNANGTEYIYKMADHARLRVERRPIWLGNIGYIPRYFIVPYKVIGMCIMFGISEPVRRKTGQDALGIFRSASLAFHQIPW